MLLRDCIHNSPNSSLVLESMRQQIILEKVSRIDINNMAHNTSQSIIAITFNCTVVVLLTSAVYVYGSNTIRVVVVGV